MARTSRIQQYPGGPQAVVAIPVDAGVVWGVQSNDFGDADGDFWWFGDGTSVADVVAFPGDTDAWNISDLGGTNNFPQWPAGGSDGTFLLHPVISSTGQWYVDQFSTSLELLDRFLIPGWSSAGYPLGTGYLFQSGRIKHLSAGVSMIVVIADRFNDSLEHESIDGAVLTSDGSFVTSWSILTPVLDEFGTREEIDSQSGSCLDGDETEIFFGLRDIHGDTLLVAANIETGERRDVFNIVDVDNAITDSYPDWGGLSSVYGVLELDGDFFLTGSSGTARVLGDGTPVWWDDSQLDGESYYGLAFSGADTVWACHSDTNVADEFSYDGELLQTLTIAEPAMHAWLVAVNRPIGISELGKQTLKMATVIQTSHVRRSI